MSMHEVICPTCGAINHAEADTCWRCLAQVYPAAQGSPTPSAHAASA
jgi:acetone carboxylase gamma subunit